ncbi:hypothetical protein O6H91_22G056200 [Diphasiastrum complanatum]|uniref:Uncharacterized protein n=1 Tax=Diphasiastrum complanatum TaxID=34168 RepID=A0ACC2AG09_DIPCM|nr:hypothetical protein O6H91_22G056200 [Diphasiastrum complanatum]
MVEAAGGAPDLPATQLGYFDDMWQLQASAHVLSVLVEESKIAIIVDCTILYPQGGGQPSDKGFILSIDEQTRFRVEDVRTRDGLVYHYGFFEASDLGNSSTFQIGQEVILYVDKSRRQLNSRLHTAGHLIDVCIENIGLSSLQPGKGHHFPDGCSPFVEYKGAVPASDIESRRAALEAEANRLVAAGGTVQAAVCSYEEARNRCGGQLPDYIAKDSKPRIVSIGSSFGCPCGGTHVKDISEIGSMKVSQIRVKKGLTKVSYNVLPFEYPMHFEN